MTTESDVYAMATDAAQRLADRTGAEAHEVAVVLGSGWNAAADELGTADIEFAVDELPGFVAPTVEGHHGRIRSVAVGELRALVFLGRTHLYEAREVDPVVHPVRTAIAAGARTVILTNAAGSLRTDFKVGQPILIADHINLTGRSPLLGPRFVDLTDAYARELRALARDVDPSLAEGVYACLPGPHYETASEIRMLRTIGADLVGMSTALETIAAREGGADVLGMSLVTNTAAGLTGEPLDHEDVVAAGRSAAPDLGRFLAALIARLPR